MGVSLQLADVFFKVDQRDLDLTRPETWRTEDGRPLTPGELAIVHQAGPEDWQAVHDLSVLDGASCSCHGA